VPALLMWYPFGGSNSSSARLEHAAVLLVKVSGRANDIGGHDRLLKPWH
jgi:hypothetical protein